MSKAFSDSEKQIIRQQLIDCAGELITTKGMQKTRVDEIAAKCHIAKGSFYSFFDNKELLFWEVLQGWHNQIHETLNKLIRSCKDINVDTLTDILTEGYESCFRIGLGKMLMGGEMDYLMRKLPPELVQKHFEEDSDVIEELLGAMPGANKIDKTVYAGAFRGIFLFLMYEKEIGAEFHAVLKLTIRGVVIQILDEIKKSGKEPD